MAKQHRKAPEDSPKAEPPGLLSAKSSVLMLIQGTLKRMPENSLNQGTLRHVKT